jgi:hypothetical protein
VPFTATMSPTAMISGTAKTKKIASPGRILKNEATKYKKTTIVDAQKWHGYDETLAAPTIRVNWMVLINDKTIICEQLFPYPVPDSPVMIARSAWVRRFRILQ